MIYPSINEFGELSKSGKAVPVIMEIPGDYYTPISIFSSLVEKDEGFLLESVENGERLGRYSFIGRKPFMTLEVKKGVININRGKERYKIQGDPFKEIKKIMSLYKTVKLKKSPPFTGGAIGFFGYDTVKYFEEIPEPLIDDLKMPEIHLMLFDEVIAYDHLKSRVQLIVNVAPAEEIEETYCKAVERLKILAEKISKSRNSISVQDLSLYDKKREVKFESSFTREEFCSAVKKAKNYIKKGDVFQVVISQRLAVNSDIPPFQAYRKLRGLNPSPYMYYINFGEYQVVGSSPEMLVKTSGSEVETNPIAGTRRRGKDELEDEKLANELLQDSKEIAEHMMLVDLGRNDIGRVARFGTVKVIEQMKVEKYSHVMHLVSRITGEMRDDADMFDALKACLPAGTVSGAPKVRAMEIIYELEKQKRGLYAGAVGYISFDGNLDTCIAIRTILFKSGKAYIQAGAGIVADSIPDKEYEETLNKAKALLEVI